MATEKTTVYLNSEDYGRIKALARQRGRRVAELLREAVAEYADRHATAAVPTSVGLARTGRPDLSERTESLLEGLGEA